MQNYEININSAEYRTGYRPQPLPLATRIKLLERYLRENAHFGWTDSYKKAEAELAALKGA